MSYQQVQAFENSESAALTSMAIKRFLVLLPIQALLLLAPAGQAQDRANTWFVPEGHTGLTCKALIPSCMKRSQWAQVCKGRKQDNPNYEFPKSCRDALGLQSSD